MIVKVVNKSSYDLPSYQTSDSAGMDLRANILETIVLKPMQRVLVPTGLFLEIPKGYEAQVRPRSGLALKRGITVLNSPGTIDADYRGELQVILINLSDALAQIEPGERMAQIVFAACVQAHLEGVDILSQTERNAGGFGSTGV